VSDFHEEFEGQAAGAEPVAAGPRDPAAPSLKLDGEAEVETADVDAAVGGAGYGHSPAEPAVEVGPEEPAVAEALNAVASPEGAEPGPSADAAAAQYLALAQRTQADFENFRKRAARDAALAEQRGVIKLVKGLLPAVDNLERAISHAAAEDPLLDGIKFVLSDLLAALSRAGIESFDPAGESFDPTLHEAVAQFPKEGVDAGTVVEVYQQGYRLGDTVLRPARVVVSA
jgi:molecular chaperone GrpE